MEQPDLSNCFILIATPIMDGKVERSYQESLTKTIRLLEALKAKVDTISSRYCADISLARSRLFGSFLRYEGATHILFIDSDMEWHQDVVVTMLLQQREFIAAIGPKKQYPITFAYNCVDKNFKKIPMVHELETGVAEISHVGGAFVLMTRDCCQKLADGYPELRYYSDNDVIEYDIFASIIIKTEEGALIRLSEDYAVCHRWRELGGKIEILMDVTFGHTGSHKFVGNFLDYCVSNDPDFNKVEHGEEEK